VNFLTDVKRSLGDESDLLLSESIARTQIFY
jgi:hypothetical protein